jgi:hypothetical protein
MASRGRLHDEETRSTCHDPGRARDDRLPGDRRLRQLCAQRDQRPGGTSQCVYGDGGLVITVTDAGKTLYNTQRQAITAAPAGTWSDISGLGDRAFEAHGGSESSVSFYKGATAVTITLAGSTLQAPTAAAIAVAKVAASRI